MFSLESPLRGDSNEYTQSSIFNIKKKITKSSKICSHGICFKGLENQFVSAVVNEPLLFESLKVWTRTSTWYELRF